MMHSPGGYPADLESAVLLADGRAGAIRPVVPSDLAAVRALYDGLSEQSSFFRFFSIGRSIPEGLLERWVNVDYRDRMALVLLDDGELVGTAYYERLGASHDAEVAFTVRDDEQGRGIGTILLEHLASAGRAAGLSRFIAETLADNARMLRVFADAGFEERSRYEAGVVRVELELSGGPRYSDLVEERDRLAAVASIERLLRPRSVAVIGASAKAGSIGHELVRNIVQGGFTGAVYPVNPAAGEIEGLTVYPAVGAIGSEVDLAVVAVPAARVAQVIEECGKSGVGGLVVISAGFAEVGSDGRSAERELVDLARSHGMRMIGPNCMGIVNTDPEISLDATFAPVAPIRGPVAFSSQSGGLGIAILNEAGRRGLGVSSFVSVGNKADVSGNDLLRYWEADATTDVILLYLESFGNPRHFSQIARRIAKKKPIVAVKSGRSVAGSRGASSHTAAMASPDATVDALFHQAGVIRVDTLEELFDVAEVLAHQPLPAGRRVAILGNAGGPGVLAADACEGYGLEVPELSEATSSALRTLLGPAAAVRNPVDCIASATAEQFRTALELVLADEVIDAVIVIFTPPLVTAADDVAAAVADVAATAHKPILANFLSTTGALAALRSGEHPIPWFAYPESAARALGRIVPYAAWRSQPTSEPPAYDDLDAKAARVTVDGVIAERGGGWLSATEADELLRAYRIPVLATRRVSSAGEAVAAAKSLGFPVAAKIDVQGVVHKSDVGGVLLGLSDEAAVAEAVSGLLGKFGSDAAVVVQPMSPVGVETIVGVVEVPSFGPLVMFGLGGTATELLGDRALSLVPLSEPEARGLVTSLRSSPLLLGYRGAPPVDIGALSDLLCRVARLAGDVPEVVEMDLNPVVATPSGCIALDCKIRLAPQPAEPALRRRHLR